MVELVDNGYLTLKDINEVVVDLVDMVYKDGVGVIGIYKKGYTVLLTTCGLEIADRERRWVYKTKDKRQPIIQILTVQELAEFVEENSELIDKGKTMAALQVLSFKLEELLDEVYIGNYDEIFKDMRGNM